MRLSKFAVMVIAWLGLGLGLGLEQARGDDRLVTDLVVATLTAVRVRGRLIIVDRVANAHASSDDTPRCAGKRIVNENLNFFGLRI